MNAKQTRNTRAAATCALQDNLRKLLHMEMEILESNPGSDALQIREAIQKLADARSDPAAYDRIFNEYLASLSQEETSTIDPATMNPAALGRLYNQWDRQQHARLEELRNSLNDVNALTAEQRLRAALEQSLETVLTASSIYGATITEQLELMNPTAADASRPIIISGPDGLKMPIRHWYQILLFPISALADRGAINPHLCPVQLSRARHPVLQHQGGAGAPADSGNPKHTRQLTGGFTLSIHHAVPQICRIAADTLRALGHHPEDYTIQYHPKDVAAPDRQTSMFDGGRCQPQETPALPAPTNAPNH